MNQTLLSGLDSSDIDWLVSIGQIEQVTTGQVLVKSDNSIKTLYLIIEGELKMSLPQDRDDLLHQAFKLLENSQVLEQELLSLTTGELVGENLLFKSESSNYNFIAQRPTRLLAISYQELKKKIEKDLAFSARFYKVIATLLAERLIKLREKLRSRKLSKKSSANEDIILLLGEINDSDIDWMIKNGTVQTIEANTILFQEGKPAENMYILLSGLVSITLAETKINPLDIAFTALENIDNFTAKREIITLKQGAILGEMPFGLYQISSVNVRCLEDSKVLAIPRNLLATKLQENIGFSARFYRAVSLLAIERFQTTVELLDYQRRFYSSEKTLESSIPYDDEMSDNRLDNFTLAGSRFKWMLKRLKSLNHNQHYVS